MQDVTHNNGSNGSGGATTLKAIVSHKPEHASQDGSNGATLLVPTNPRHPMFQMGRDHRMAEREHEISRVMASIIRRTVASK